jgi:hypothetical protein
MFGIGDIVSIKSESKNLRVTLAGRLEYTPKLCSQNEKLEILAIDCILPSYNHATNSTEFGKDNNVIIRQENTGEVFFVCDQDLILESRPQRCPHCEKEI